MATFSPITVADLIQAILDANNNGQTDVIELNGNTYTLLDDYNNSGTGLPVIASDITINGHGATITRSTSPGTPTFRIFEMTNTGRLTLSDLTVSHGQTTGDGAGILNLGGSLAIYRSTLTGNNGGGIGGAIASSGPCIVEESTISGNEAVVGGGIGLANGSLRVITSTIADNNASSSGGGIYSYECESFIVDSVINNNYAGEAGGGIWPQDDRLTIADSIIDSNYAGTRGTIDQVVIPTKLPPSDRSTGSPKDKALFAANSSETGLDPFNDRLAIQVNSTTGQFNMGAFPDATGGSTDNSWDLMFRWPYPPNTSFSTLRVDNVDTRYGDSPGVFIQRPADIDGITNTAIWQVGQVKVTQLLQIVPNPVTGEEDLAKISYTVENLDTVNHQVGLRIMIDTEIKNNDGAPFRVPNTGIVTQETEFVGANVPENFQVFRGTDPHFVASAVLRRDGEIAPDRLVFASWPNIEGTDYDFTVTPSCDFTDDSAYAVYWLPQSLAPGASRTYVTYYGLGYAECVHEGPCDCEMGAYACLDGKNSSNPISLYKGEKREEVTDLTLNVPAGQLSFTRTYRQSKQAEWDSIGLGMGLGWTHNHAISLTPPSGSPGVIVVRMPHGGEAHFTEQSADYYVGDAGATSFIDWNNGTQQYTLTTPDQSIFVFGSDGKLLFRSWPAGETWTYSYDDNTLTQVTDDYGNKLVFCYLNGLLYRVGDQTFNDTDPNNPTGRYVEFSYSLNKIVDGDSGAIINGSASLLTGVQDVLDQVWTYTYYAETDKHADVRQLNFLIKRESPSVDTDGDQTPDSILVLEEVIYTMQGQDLAEDGSMELPDLNTPWQGIPGAAPNINERSSAQVEEDEGDFSRHVYGDTAGKGIEGNAWDLVDGLTYIVTARVYLVSGTVKMQVTGRTDFDRNTGGSTGAWQTLRVVHKATADAQDVKLQFIASGGAAEFYVDAVSIIETDLSVVAITQERGDAMLVTDLTFLSTLGTATTETISGTNVTTTHRFFGGVHVGTFDPLGNEQGSSLNSVFRPYAQRDANGNETQLVWSADGKHLEQVTDALDHTTQFDYDPDDGTLNYSLDARGRKTQYVYGETPRQPTDVKVIDSDGTTVRRWQKFEYDAKGRTVVEKTVDPANEALELQKVTRTYFPENPQAHDPGEGLLESVTQVDVEQPANNKTTWYTYDQMGRVIKTRQTSLLGGCQYSYTVYDAAGNVLATVCGLQNTTPPATVAEALQLYTNDPAHTRVTVYEYDTLGRRVKTTANAGASFADTTLTLYDALGRVWRIIAKYNNPEVSPGVYEYTAPGTWEWDEAAKSWKDQTSPTAKTISHGSDNTENIIADTKYNAFGLVRLRRAALGNVTLYGYDDAGRLVKTVQNAATSDHNNDFVGGDPNEADPSLSAYPYSPHVLSTDPDQDIITEQVYDAAGNLVKVVDATGQVSFTVYDPLNRLWRTLRGAKDGATIDLNSGDPNYSAANDPRLPVEGALGTVYVPSLDPDKDLIEETEYDNMGRVVQTRRLLDTRGGTPQWAVTRYVYDELDRQVRTIASYVPQGDPETDPADWAWVTDHWTYAQGSAVDHGANDQNLITETVYDEAGRVQETLDVNRTRTRSVYDGLGRQVKTIANCSYTSGFPAPEEAAYKGNLSDSSADIITETFYDADGRVQKTKRVLKVNQAGDDLEWLWTLYGYDTSGRQVKLVQNASNPIYDMVGDPDLSGYTPSGLSDEDIISETAYDGQGRVKKVIDSRGNVSFYGYDTAGRRIKTVQNASNTNYDVDADPDLSGYTPAGSPGNDQDRITTTTYDLVGRVDQAVDAAGVVTVYMYDALGRRVRTITNYVEQGDPVVPPEQWVWSETNQRWEDGSANAIEHNTAFDQNLIADTSYNKAGQIIATRDSRGTQTAFVYDGAARQQQVQSAAGSALETWSYTCYDKSGRVLRTIANWTGEGFPDEQESGAWTFAPGYNDGGYNDRNRIVAYTYDAIGRRVKVIDPVGNETTTVYFMDGQVDMVADPEDVISLYCYDGLGRRVISVANFVPQYDGQNEAPPDTWVWNDTLSRWEGTTTVPSTVVIDHGTGNDRNIIVRVAYDKAGRMLEQREPNGNLTAYRFGKLGRRITQVTNYKPQGTSDPANWVWNDNATPPRWERSVTDTTAIEHGTLGDENAFITQTTYQNVQNGNGFTGETRVTVTKPDGTQTIRDADRLGRPTVIDYGDSANTYKATFVYNTGGSRESMTENDGTFDQRITGYEYDALRRLTRAKFDTDADLTWNDEVAYEYDLGGQRTKLTLPGDLSVTYSYDLKGRLVSLTDWDGHQTRFAHDNANRLIAAERASGLTSRYRYDAAGRLRQLRHTHGARTLAHFAYEVDKRGNRIQAVEALVQNATNGVTYPYDDASIVWRGTWAPDAATYMKSEGFSASLELAFFGPSFELTVGAGVNHSIFDVYVNGSLWRSFDGYAASGGELTVGADLASDGPHILELRNRAEHSLAAQADASYDQTKFIVRFKQLALPDVEYDLHTLEYSYDKLSRLIAAYDYPGINTSLDETALPQWYTFTYDRAGNRETQTLRRYNVIDPDLTASYTYNAANQIANTGFTYDANGNLTSDGVNTYTWNRANRLTSMGGLAYGYDGAGNRIRQSDGVDVTQYLLDLQPGLPLVVAQTKNGVSTDRFVHLPGRGIFAQEDNTGMWQDLLLDGLGSTRMVVDDTLSVDSLQSYAPYGEPLEMGSFGSPFTFTGELLDANDLLYLRARFYSPALGVFTALDPLENLNRYQYVGANPTNWIDPGGLNVLTSEFNIITYGGYYGLGEVMLLKRGASNAILETPTSLSIFAPPPGVNDPTADYTPIPPIPMSSPITGFSYYAPPSVSFPGWQLYGRPQYSFANYEQDTSFSDASAGLKQIVQTFAEQSGIRIAQIIPADINENRVKFIGSERVEFLANSIEICAGAVDPAVPSGSAAQVPEIGNIWEDETGGSQSIGTAKDTGPALGGRSGPGNAPVVSVAAVGGVVALGTANTAMCSFQAPHNLKSHERDSQSENRYNRDENSAFGNKQISAPIKLQLFFNVCIA